MTMTSDRIAVPSTTNEITKLTLNCAGECYERLLSAPSASIPYVKENDLKPPVSSPANQS
jgi:hypothetical protein